jgi:AcrR family transcriptional regulator
VASSPATRPLTRRAIPSQARSALTVEKILDAATTILFERGLQGLNTNAVAATAGINVATLYHYFPDKVAILAELFRRDQTRRSEFLVMRLEELPAVADIDEWTADLIHSIVQLRRQVPTAAVLRQACRTVPQLLEIEEADNDRLVDHFSRVLRRRFRQLSPNRARHAARTLIETGAALLDRASLDLEHSPGLIKETIAMLSAYLDRLDEGF